MDTAARKTTSFFFSGSWTRFMGTGAFVVEN